MVVIVKEVPTKNGKPALLLKGVRLKDVRDFKDPNGTGFGRAWHWRTHDGV